MTRNDSSLVVVPGHAVFLGNSSDDLLNPHCWSGPFVAAGGHLELEAYLEHIEAGAREACRRSGLLLFSGGATRADTRLAEGATYRIAATAKGELARVESESEDYARDSFENILFSIYRFRDLLGSLPGEVIAVGFRFKAPRFIEHADTILRHADRLSLAGWSGAFHYVGVNDPAERIDIAQAGEAQTIARYRANPLGESTELQEKRCSRDPWARPVPYPYHQP